MEPITVVRTNVHPGAQPARPRSIRALAAVLLSAAAALAPGVALAAKLAVNVVGVDPAGAQTPVASFRWIVEENLTKRSIPGAPTCTAICPVMSRIFAKVPAELGADAGRVRFVSLSIDPEHDTPERLAAYARRYGAGPRWTFLTGAAADVRAVERAFDAFRGDKMNHEPLTLVRAAPGRPWTRIDGFASPAELAREYGRAAREVALR